MGNLPLSRTITLGPDDPIPSDLLNEIQDVLISGDGTNKTIVIPASAASATQSAGDSGAQPNGGSWNFQQFGTTTATALYVYYPITLPVGVRIKSWSLSLNKQTNNTHDISADCIALSLSGSLATVIGTAQVNSGNSPGNTTIGEAGIVDADALVDASHQYVVRVKSPDSQASNGVDQSCALVVTYGP